MATDYDRALEGAFSPLDTLGRGELALAVQNRARREHLADLANTFANQVSLARVEGDQRMKALDAEARNQKDLAKQESKDRLEGDRARAIYSEALRFKIPTEGKSLGQIEREVKARAEENAKGVLSDYDSQIKENARKMTALAASMRGTIDANASPQAQRAAILETVTDPAVGSILSPGQIKGLLGGTLKPDQVFAGLTDKGLFGNNSKEASLFYGKYLEELNKNLDARKQIDLAVFSDQLRDLQREREDLIRGRIQHIRDNRYFLGDISAKTPEEPPAPANSPKLDAKGLLPDLGRTGNPSVTPSVSGAPPVATPPIPAGPAAPPPPSSSLNGPIPKAFRFAGDVGSAVKDAVNLGIVRPVLGGVSNAYDALFTGRPMQPTQSFYTPEEQQRLAAAVKPVSIPPATPSESPLQSAVQDPAVLRKINEIWGTTYMPALQKAQQLMKTERGMTDEQIKELGFRAAQGDPQAIQLGHEYVRRAMLLVRPGATRDFTPGATPVFQPGSLSPAAPNPF